MRLPGLGMGFDGGLGTYGARELSRYGRVAGRGTRAELEGSVYDEYFERRHIRLCDARARWWHVGEMAAEVTQSSLICSPLGTSN